MRISVVAMLALVLNASAAWAKKPLPDKPKLEAAKIAARDRYFKELKNANSAALKSFLDAADATADDDARQAALYFIVADAAIESGNLRLALDAQDRLGNQFEYDAPAGKLKSLEAASKTVKTSDARTGLVNRLMELMDEAVDGQRLDVAGQAAKLAESVAVKLRDARLRKELAAKRTVLEGRRREARAEATELELAKALLEGDPNNREANRVVGLYLTTGEKWSEAVTHLAKADDADLRAAAEAEVKRPDDAKEQLALADLWWVLADSFETEKQRVALRTRANYWYGRAVAGLKGLAKTRAARRMHLSGEETAVAAARQSGVDDTTADVLLAPGLTLRLVKIPGSDDERVKPFYLAATEMTEAQWATVAGGLVTSRDRPKVKVSFAECRLICEKLNSLPVGRRFSFRLPTREEFAHACGNAATYPGELQDYAWCRENSPEQIQPVGRKKPNPLGLYDLVGNVWEWADDGKFYGMSSWDTIRDLNPVLQSHELPPNYFGQRADYSGDNLGVRVAANLR